MSECPCARTAEATTTRESAVGLFTNNVFLAADTKAGFKKRKDEVVSSCPAGSVMTVCHCQPWSNCDGARMVNGRCVVNRKKNSNKKVKVRA